MAHANIFERISSNDRKDTTMNKKALETIKLVGQQVIEISKTVDLKDQTIDLLKKELSTLKKKNAEMEGDLKLLMINQKDLTKQLRMLKAAVTGQEFARPAQANQEDFSERVISNYQPEQVIRTSSVREDKPDFRSKSIKGTAQRPQAIAQMKPVSSHQAEPSFSNDKEMDDAYLTISTAINHARAKLGLDPHEDLPGTIKEHNRIYQQPAPVETPAQKTAKDFVFGRLPRMLDLD
ncbi:MAG: hypothetical protein HOA17_09145 [Candidatus Melainabacteria bacterium]|jgi:hypothetical protein|nr:hypothetical protein [Candidatus Melainabacteria bacterium]